MFEAEKHSKETDFQLLLMENRLKKLEDEDKKTKKKIMKTLEKTL